MRKIYCFLFLLLISGSLMAQVHVTYKVDVRKYLQTGTLLGANGIRIGGDFAVTGAMNGETAMPDWSPSNAACALTDMGDSIWAITVTYPVGSVGLTQQYKFVNNDWGTNEGTDEANTIATDGCGTDDGAGNINRTLEIPATDVTLQFCWDACFRCNGGIPDITGVRYSNPVSAVAVFPNPVTDVAAISMHLNKPGDVAISIINLLGQEILSVKHYNESAGNHSYNIDASAIPSGMYMYRVVAGKVSNSGNFVKL
jgi:hypothetical protein